MERSRFRFRFSKNGADKVLLVAICLCAGFLGGWAGSRNNNPANQTSTQIQKQVIHKHINVKYLMKCRLISNMTV